MEKILLAIDPANPNTQALQFACYLARLTGSKITGVFLENLLANEYEVLQNEESLMALNKAAMPEPPISTAPLPSIEQSIQLFKETCEKRSLRCTVHHDKGVPTKELIEESRFADIIVTDAAISFAKSYEGVPSRFARDVLKDAECPVIIAPKNFTGIDEIIFTYSNTKSCAFAIKQFTYLFPELDELKVTILHVNETGEWDDAEKHPLKEWLQNRYSAVGFQSLEGKTDEKLSDYLFGKKNAFIVMGSYGRNALSTMLKHSCADPVLNTITQPIFIAHP